MTTPQQDIVFFGTEDFSLTTLAALVDADFPVKLVVTKPDTLRGRKKILTAPAVKTYALDHAIAVLQPKKLGDITQDIEKLNTPVGVLVSFGKIIPQSIIDCFNPGIINLHPSLLPNYRGPSPIESAIVNGDDMTGISIMQLSAAMDAGPVYYQETVALNGAETQPELYDKLGKLGATRMVEQLPQILAGAEATPQDAGNASYCQLLSSANATIDPTVITADQFERHIRAYADFPRTKLTWNAHSLIITEGHVTSTQKTPLDIKCRNGAFLSIDTLIAPSGKTMRAEDFLNGYAAG